VTAVVDTNVLIDYLQGYHAAAEEFGRYDAIAVSAISAADLWTLATDGARVAAVETLLATCDLVSVDAEVARQAGSLRRAHRLRLPDALVWATARVRGHLLVTRDEGFPADTPEIRHPYRLP
jgi:predicted nucleic acid-binding protein